MQLLKDSLSPMRKRPFSITGIKRNASKSNCNSQKISHNTLSMMDHHLPPVLPITVTLLLEPSRMLFADMPCKLVTMFLEDSVGIATDSLSNTKLIRNSKSLIRDKSWKWVLPNTMKHAEALL